MPTMDNNTTPVWPTDYFEIGDICLWSTSLSRNDDVVAFDHSKMRYRGQNQFRIDYIEGQREDETIDKFYRFYIKITLKGATPLAPESDALTDVYTLEATFAMDAPYKREVTEQEAAKFCRENALHLVWPFWRQHVYTTLKAASLPVPRVPMRSPLIPSRDR